MFSGLGAQSSTSRRSATHKCNGLCNLAYFLLGFTFPEGQKKTNKEWRSCFSSRLAGGGLSTCLWVEAGVEPELCALGLGVGDWKSCLQFRCTADWPSREALLCSFPSLDPGLFSFTYLHSWSELNTVQIVPTSYAHTHDIAAMSRWSRCSAAQRYRHILMYLTLMTN